MSKRVREKKREAERERERERGEIACERGFDSRLLEERSLRRWID